MANGFVIDEVGGCGKCFLSFIWIVLTIFAVTLAITEILQLGFITKSIQQDIQSKDGSLLGLVHSSVDNEKFDALLSSSDAITFQELIQNGKMEDIEENIKEYKRNLLTQTYTINDEESDSSDSSNTPETYIFYDVEPNLKIYNQFQATSCQPYVVIDKSKKSVDDLTMSGNATFYWFNESSENTKDNFNQPGGSCFPFKFIFLRNTFESSYAFFFLFHPENYTSLILTSQRGNPVVMFSKLTFSTILTTMSILVFILYGILYFVLHLYKKDDEHFCINNFVMLGFLIVFNDPFSVLRYFFNANWLSNIHFISYVIYQIVLICYIFIHIDHSRSVCYII